MLYMLVVCAGGLCLPVETVRDFSLSQAQCETRMVTMQAGGADAHCYSNSESESWPDHRMLVFERSFTPGTIAH
jgi:hypothetical protein